MKHTFRVIALCLFATAITLSSVTTSFAATKPSESGQALEIAPPVLNVRGNPGETVKGNISLRDVSPTSLVVTSQINDFTAQGEEGMPKLLLDEGESSPYSMKTWFRPIGRITLKSREIQGLPFVIDIPKDAAPGGYFAVVRFSASPAGIDSTGVSLSASVGALIFMRVNGEAKEKLSIVSFNAVDKQKQPKTLLEGTPITFAVRVKNEGNVHEQPSGRIIIKDMFGKTVAGLNVNMPPRNVLPGSIRRFESKLDETVIGNKKLFGRYRAEVSITDAKGQTVTDNVTFWVIPWKLMLLGTFGLVLGFLLLRRMIRNYNQAIVRRATGAPKPQKKRIRRKK
jgi:hypothetical protein